MAVKKYLKDNVPTLRAESLGDLQSLRLIDVRRTDEYVGELGHIEGAALHPLGEPLEDFLKLADKSIPTLFICRSGARSGSATLMAMREGFKEVYNLEGGMLGWKELGFPVER